MQAGPRSGCGSGRVDHDTAMQIHCRRVLRLLAPSRPIGSHCWASRSPALLASWRERRFLERSLDEDSKRVPNMFELLAFCAAFKRYVPSEWLSSGLQASNEVFLRPCTFANLSGYSCHDDLTQSCDCTPCSGGPLKTYRNCPFQIPLTCPSGSYPNVVPGSGKYQAWFLFDE